MEHERRTSKLVLCHLDSKGILLPDWLFMYNNNNVTKEGTYGYFTYPLYCTFFNSACFSLKMHQIGAFRLDYSKNVLPVSPPAPP